MMTMLLLAAALALPKWWSVHIDHPADRATYESIDRQEGQLRRDILAKHGLPMPQWLRISTSDGAYFVIRPRGAELADVDKPSTVPADVQKEIAAAWAPLDPRIHASLHEHHNELWELDSDSSVVRDGAAPKFIRLRVDVVKPDKWDEYNKVLARVHDAVAKAGAGVLVFESTYGDGTMRLFFTSDEPLDLHRLLGDPLLRDWRALVVETHELEAKARPDLMAADASQWLAPHAP